MFALKLDLSEEAFPKLVLKKNIALELDIKVAILTLEVNAGSSLWAFELINWFS